MRKVASTGVGRAAVVVTKIGRGHNSERPDACQRTRF
jgi:hypothetical protein